jgi:hypothetical protein
MGQDAHQTRKSLIAGSKNNQFLERFLSGVHEGHVASDCPGVFVNGSPGSRYHVRALAVAPALRDGLRVTVLLRGTK